MAPSSDAAPQRDHPQAKSRRGHDPSLGELKAAGQLPTRGHWVALAIAVVFVALVSFAASVTTPYVVIEPGSVQPLDTVRFEGAAAPPVAERGDIELVTVKTGRATLADRFYALIRDDVEIVPLERTRPSGESDRDVQRRDDELMFQSKEAAEYAALKWLGYPVTIDGGGALINEVSTETAAAQQLQKGDVIIDVGGKPISLITDIREALAPHEVGDPVAVRLVRAGITTEVEVPVSASHDDPPRKILGIIVSNAGLRVVTPFEVKIPTGNISGPSAGLAFGLEIVDMLTAGDLTGGHRVVASGVLAPNGSVSAVGGIRQKAEAVEASGAKYFIVPKENAAEARSGSSKIEIVPVSNLDEAIAFMGRLSGHPLQRPQGG